MPDSLAQWREEFQIKGKSHWEVTAKRGPSRPFTHNSNFLPIIGVLQVPPKLQEVLEGRIVLNDPVLGEKLREFPFGLRLFGSAVYICADTATCDRDKRDAARDVETPLEQLFLLFFIQPELILQATNPFQAGGQIYPDELLASNSRLGSWLIASLRQQGKMVMRKHLCQRRLPLSSGSEQDVMLCGEKTPKGLRGDKRLDQLMPRQVPGVIHLEEISPVP